MGQVVTPVTLEKGLRAEFMKSYKDTQDPRFMSLATKVPSTARSEKYGWLGSVPQLREFKDAKVPKGLLDHDYTVANVPYEATLGVDKYALEDDQLGATQMRIKDLAVRAKGFPVKLLTDLLANGATDLCYDGQAFFSASHAEGASGTQSNIVTGTGVTAAQFMADFRSGRQSMISFKDDQGEPFYEGELKLICVLPPGLQGIAEEVFNATTIANNSNVLKGASEMIVSSRLTGNDWYMVEVSGEIRALILQERNPVSFGALEGQSENGFMRRHYYYGVEWRGAGGYGLWQKAIKINNA